jgi:hypothetical protein
MPIEFPVVFRMAGLSVSAHLLLETMAFIIGYQYYLKLRSRIKDWNVEHLIGPHCQLPALVNNF